MCMSTPKAPEAPKAVPPPDPAPMPTPDETAPASAESGRKSRLQRMKAGLHSTIKTSPQGTGGSGLYDSKLGA
jgi:hypothetical protein